jgi:HTH-type transcriptional regulator/antitoxin HipB
MKDTRLKNAEQLGRAIRLKRQGLGLSQSALAELLGVERKWVLRLEAGNPKAEFALVLKALDAVGIGALLRDDSRTGSSAQSSRLDEVFQRVQRRK